jgi:hypothetical protein
MTLSLVLRARAARAAGLLLLAFAPVGCDPGAGSLVGTVSFNGRPLPGGIVAVVSADGRAAESKIAEDGSYAIAQAPAGTLKVSVVTQPPISGMKSPNPMARNAPKDPNKPPEPFAPLGKYVAIPKRYHDTANSGLTCTVVKGRQTTYDIPLEP